MKLNLKMGDWKILTVYKNVMPLFVLKLISFGSEQNK